MKNLLESAEYFLDDGSDLLPSHITESEVKEMIASFKKSGFVLSESQFREVAIHALGGDLSLNEWNDTDYLLEKLRAYAFGEVNLKGLTTKKEIDPSESLMKKTYDFFEAIHTIASIDKYEIFKKHGVEDYFAEGTRGKVSSDRKDPFLDFMFVVQKNAKKNTTTVIQTIAKCLSAVSEMIDLYSGGTIIKAQEEEDDKLGKTITPGHMHEATLKNLGAVLGKIALKQGRMRDPAIVPVQEVAKKLAKALSVLQSVTINSAGKSITSVTSHLTVFSRMMKFFEKMSGFRSFAEMFRDFLDVKHMKVDPDHTPEPELKDED